MRAFHDNIQDLPETLKEEDVEVLGTRSASVLTSTISSIRAGSTYDLQTPVSVFHGFKGGLDGDCIYSLTSIANDGAGWTPPVSMADRHSTFERELYIEFTRRSISESRSLDIVCRHWALPVKYDGSRKGEVPMPSWVSPAARAQFDRKGRRKNGENFVASSPSYNDVGRTSTKATIKAQPPQMPDPNHPPRYVIDEIEGFKVGKISAQSEVVGTAGVPSTGLGILGWQPGDENVPELRWCVLVADRTAKGDDAPSWYGVQCRSALKGMASKDYLCWNTGRKNRDGDLAEFLQRMESVTFNRRVIKIEPEANGATRVFYGLGPSGSKPGGSVYVLRGCTMPVVLANGLNGAYEIRGEAFVHRIMNDELKVGKASTICSIKLE